MKKHKKTRQLYSTQSFLPVYDIEDNIIVTKDGRYYKLLEFSPINFELRAPSERQQIIRQFSAAIKTFPENVHLKVISAPSEIGTFIQGIEEKMKSEPSESCRMMQEDQISMLKEMSKARAVSRRFFLSFPYEEPPGFHVTPPFTEIKDRLDRTERSIQIQLEACGNYLISEQSREYTLSALYSAICSGIAEHMDWKNRKREVEERYIREYRSSTDLRRIPAGDYIAPGRIESAVSPNYLIVDGKYITYCYVPEFAYPTEAAGGWLQILFSYMDEISVDFWIRKMPVSKVQQRLLFELKNTKVRMMHSDQVDQDYDELSSTLNAGYYIKNAMGKGDDFCYMATMVTIYGNSPEEVNNRFREMNDYCLRNDMVLRRCTFQQDEAFLATLPFAEPNKSIFSKSKRNIMASQLGSCYPFTAYELCDEGGVFVGLNARYGSPVFINNFDTAKYENGSMIISGMSGSGKTYTLSCLLLRMRQQGTQVFLIAPLKGFEFYRATKAVGGEIIRIAPGSAQNINIMEIRKRNSASSDVIDGTEAGEQSSILAEKIQQLHRFFSLLIPDITPEEKQVLDEALLRTYAKFGITTRNKSLFDPNVPGKYKPMPILGDLHREISQTGAEGKRLYSLLSRFVTGSARSFNAQTNINTDNRFVLLDVSDLTKEMLPIGMFIALDYVMDKARQTRTDHKVIAIDEMWKLMSASDLSAEFVVEVFKTIRGYAGAAIGATQDIEDILNNEYGSAIVNNSKIKILLPMQANEVAAVSQVIELTDAEYEQITATEGVLTARNGKRKPSRALIIANKNHIFVNVRASKTEHDLITTTASDLRRILEEKREGVQP